MSKNRIVTEASFRKREYSKAKVEDYEYDEHDRLVRIDRWRTSIYKIAEAIGLDADVINVECVVRKTSEIVRKALKPINTVDFSKINEVYVKDNTKHNSKIYINENGFVWKIIPPSQVHKYAKITDIYQIHDNDSASLLRDKEGIVSSDSTYAIEVGLIPKDWEHSK